MWDNGSKWVEPNNFYKVTAEAAKISIPSGKSCIIVKKKRPCEPFFMAFLFNLNTLPARRDFINFYFVEYWALITQDHKKKFMCDGPDQHIFMYFGPLKSNSNQNLPMTLQFFFKSTFLGFEISIFQLVYWLYSMYDPSMWSLMIVKNIQKSIFWISYNLTITFMKKILLLSVHQSK